MEEELELYPELLPQFIEIFTQKMNKGDIQAEFDLKDSSQNKCIRINLKQLFIIIQAMRKVSGNLSLKALMTPALILYGVPSRRIWIARGDECIKDLSDVGITQQDIALRDSIDKAKSVWDRENS